MTRKAKVQRRWHGQYLSFDAMIASVIFILTLVSLLSYWHSVRLTIDNPHKELVKDADRISQLLLSAGYPPNKNCTDMDEVGLALSLSDKRLNSTQIDCFRDLVALDPDKLKEKLGTINKVAIEINTYDGNTIKIGMLPNDTAIAQNVSNSAKVRRIVSIYDPSVPSSAEKPASLDVYVYQVS